HQKITKITGWHSHHILWRSKGGPDTKDNRVLLHPTCHQQVHSQGFTVTKPPPLTKILSLPTSFGTLLRAMVTSQVVLKRPRIISALAILSAGGSKNLWVMIRTKMGVRKA